MKAITAGSAGLFVGAVAGFAIGITVGEFDRSLSGTFKEVCTALGDGNCEIASSKNDARSKQVRIAKDSQGHFRVEGTVNGRRLPFLVDTGVSVVAINATVARTLGINPSPNDFQVEVKTAKGTVKAARAVFDTMAVGEIAVSKVAGLVVPDDALPENLLGLSFLSKVKNFEYRNGALELSQ